MIDLSPFIGSCSIDYNCDCLEQSVVDVEFDICTTEHESDIKSPRISVVESSFSEINLPPPFMYRRLKQNADDSVPQTLKLEQQNVWAHIRQYKAAAGREIEMCEPARWICEDHEIQECAARAARFVRTKQLKREYS